MSDKKQKLKPDVVVSNYWKNNEHFADLFNAVLYNGIQVITPEDLEDVDTDESSVFEHRDYAESVKASRDNIKICKKSRKYNVELALLGLEGQQSIHYAMPMRIMGYDYATYKKQYDSNATKYKDASGLTGDEYLSRMKATDKFVPVITLVDIMAKSRGMVLCRCMICLIFRKEWSNLSMTTKSFWLKRVITI
jgi:hypothetical protein